MRLIDEGACILVSAEKCCMATMPQFYIGGLGLVGVKTVRAPPGTCAILVHVGAAEVQKEQVKVNIDQKLWRLINTLAGSRITAPIL